MTTQSAENTEIARLKPSQRRAASQALARAFADEPLFRYILPLKDSRRRWLKAIIRGSLRVYEKYGETSVAMVDGQAVGGMISAFPSKYPLPKSATSSMTVEMMWRGFPWDRNLILMFQRTELYEAIAKLHPKFDCYYVSMVGVQPSHQGLGLGGALLKTIHDQADADRLPTYLETQSLENVSLYQHHGYEIQAEVTPAEEGPTIWSLLRPPQSS